MSKSTPGPWFAHGPINENRRDYGVTAGKPYDPSVGALRRIAWVGNAATLHRGLEEEVAANAHLISAAPDMLAALIAVRARFQNLRLGLDESAVLDRVNEVIVKAQGQS